MIAELLTDSLENPSVWLINCHTEGDQLIAELGFISMGLVDRDYLLIDEQGQIFSKVRLPKAAIKLKEDIFCELKEEKFKMA